MRNIYLSKPELMKIYIAHYFSHCPALSLSK